MSITSVVTSSDVRLADRSSATSPSSVITSSKNWLGTRITSRDRSIRPLVSVAVCSSEISPRWASTTFCTSNLA